MGYSRLQLEQAGLTLRSLWRDLVGLADDDFDEQEPIWRMSLRIAANGKLLEPDPEDTLLGIAQLANAGYTARDLFLAGVPITELNMADYTARDLLLAGVPPTELRMAGIAGADFE